MGYVPKMACHCCLTEGGSNFCDCYSSPVHALKEGIGQYMFNLSLQWKHCDCGLLAYSLNSYFLPVLKFKISSKQWHVIHYHKLLLIYCFNT